MDDEMLAGRAVRGKKALLRLISLSSFIKVSSRSNEHNRILFFKDDEHELQTDILLANANAYIHNQKVFYDV